MHILEKVQEKLTYVHDNPVRRPGGAGVRLDLQFSTLLRAGAERRCADSLDCVTTSCARGTPRDSRWSTYPGFCQIVPGPGILTAERIAA